MINEIIKDAEKQAVESITDLLNEQLKQKEELKKLEDEIENATAKVDKVEKQINTQTNKLEKIKKLYRAVEYSINNYQELSELESLELEDLCPTVVLKIHSMDVKSLRKAYKENEKTINELLIKYEARYTTKTNIAVYKLMVLALEAELQNVLFNLKYTNLDKSIETIKTITRKYLNITTDGNQSIAPTMIRFIGELENLYLNAIKIEYEYYVNKERERAEQQAIREQMKQEVEERKQLEQQRKQVEKEEAKYIGEINKVKELLLITDNHDKLSQLNNKIEELQRQLFDVEQKKDDIIKRQNGKAGNVYIISNLGSFGENIFKVGMTRRLEPMDRVKELSDASVPFMFDVHSFIFSDDAVALEQKLHSILEKNRVNKINLRKEFFNVSIDELEKIVTEIDPTAEFNKTMIAEEYRQSQVV